MPAPVPTPSRRYSAPLVLVLFVVGFAAGWLCAARQAPAPAAPIDLTQEVTVLRREPRNGTVLVFRPFAITQQDRTTVYREYPPGARQWDLVFVDSHGRRVQIGCELIDRDQLDRDQ